MPAAHRQDDSRRCGAVTIVIGQDFTFADGKLWAVEGDPNSDGDGQLIPSQSGVFIAGIPVIVDTPDHAAPDALCIPLDGEHCDPKTAGGSPGTFAY